VGSAMPCIVIRVIQKEVWLSYSFVNLECDEVLGTGLSCGSSSTAGRTGDLSQVLKTRGEVWRGSSRSGGKTRGTDNWRCKILWC
jgi:hypothetical protein